MARSSDKNKDVVQQIRNRKEYQRTLGLIEEMRDVFEIDTKVEEIDEYQSKRAQRPLLALKKNPNKYLVTYASEDSALRSRISYVLSQSRRLLNKVNLLLDNFKSFMWAEYASSLEGTVNIKDSVFVTVLQDVSGFQSELESLSETCSIILEDIDQSQWLRKSVISVLEIESRPEGKV